MRHEAWHIIVAGVVGAVGALFTLPASAQTPLPLGPQTLANSTITGNQDESVVVVDPTGNFLVVWRDEFIDGSLSAIIGRRFSARTGLPLTPEFLINVTLDGDQRNPAVAMAADGRFVVIWEGPDTLPPVTPGIFGSLRAANGIPIQEEFQVNTTFSGVQRNPAVAMQPDGSFLVVWEDDSPIGKVPNADKNIFGRLFPATFPSAPPGSPFLVNTGMTSGDQEQAAAAANIATGGWYVGWQGPWMFSPPIPSIYLRVLNAAGGGQNEVGLNTSSNDVLRGHVALSSNASGDAVAVWEAPDNALRGIYSRRILAGVPVGVEEPVNLSHATDEREPSVAMDERGGFVTVWVAAPPVATLWGEIPEGSPIIIQGRKRNSGGGFAELAPPSDAEFQVNSSGAAFLNPWIATEPHGNFVVAWQGTDAADPEGNGTFYRRFLDAVFADGFETADTSRWSAAVP